jgi:hypothetical protein
MTSEIRLPVAGMTYECSTATGPPVMRRSLKR